MTRPSPPELFRRLLRIRRLEESLLELFSRGKLFGTTHTSIGQEAIAVAVMAALDPERDVVFSSHRCHGHFLAWGGDATALVAEIMGRATGVCGGIGGSQHLCDRSFYTSGVQGGIVPLAVGAALAERRRETGAVAAVFLGDGTLGEGVVYESLNVASLWSAPVLFVVEDNRSAQSTPREVAVSGSMRGRAAAFDIDADAVETNDVGELVPLFADRVRTVRESGRPFFQVIHTYRLAPHSKGDDDRDPAEIDRWRERDPLHILAPRLADEEREAIEAEVEAEIRRAVERADAAPWPEAGDLPQLVPRGTIPGELDWRLHAEPDPKTGEVIVARELNAALHRLLADDERVVVLGEDLADPYGGAFKVTRGLSTRFGDRVRSTPISEAAIVGVANGLALRGLLPVAEIMFGDFIALAADQIVNHAAKFEGMYNRGARCPVTIRTPVGGRRGYGPTHSQSLESLFFSVPGLEIVAPSPFHPAGELLRNAVLHSPRPTLFLENKLMYARPLQVSPPTPQGAQQISPPTPQGAQRLDDDGRAGPFAVRRGAGLYPTVHLSIDGFRSCDLVLVAYGGSAELAAEAAEHLLIEEEVACDLLVPSQVVPLPLDDLLAPVLAAGRALVVEEGVKAWGWGAEVAAALYEAAGPALAGGAIGRVGARPFPIPGSRPLEEAVLPQTRDVVAAALALVG